MDCILPGSSVHGILQARLLEWVTMPSSGDLPNPGIKPASLMSPALAGGFFTTSATWEVPKDVGPPNLEKRGGSLPGIQRLITRDHGCPEMIVLRGHHAHLEK